MPAGTSTTVIQETCHGKHQERWDDCSDLGRWERANWLTAGLVDGVGFEPTRPLQVRRFSRPVLSTAQPPIRTKWIPFLTAETSEDKPKFWRMAGRGLCPRGSRVSIRAPTEG